MSCHALMLNPLQLTQLICTAAQGQAEQEQDLSREVSDTLCLLPASTISELTLVT